MVLMIIEGQLLPINQNWLQKQYSYHLLKLLFPVPGIFILLYTYTFNTLENTAVYIRLQRPLGSNI